MKKRILYKKLKKDVELYLWIRQWKDSIKIMCNHMMKINKENYEDKTSLWYCQFKFGNYLMDYEFKQIIKIGKRKHNCKESLVYRFIHNDNNAFTYQQYKKLLNKKI